MLRFSLAGVQMKFSVKKEGDVFELSPDGAGGTHILKLPEAGKPELPENEAAMMRFAAECGIETPSLRLVRREAVRGLPERFADFDGYAYVIQRFDRASDGRRVHVEDFAQILSVHPDDKYERTSFDNLMRICWNVMGDAALAELVRRLVFSIAIANADMHLKNWSVRYANPRVPALAPAYDYVCTAAFAGYDDFLALPLAKTRHWEAVDVHAFLRAARNARVPPRIVQQAVEDTIVRIRDVWPRVRDATPESAKRIVERQLASRLFTAARS
jgi:serine/threonine-protein kinase HipA